MGVSDPLSLWPDPERLADDPAAELGRLARLTGAAAAALWHAERPAACRAWPEAAVALCDWLGSDTPAPPPAFGAARRIPLPGEPARLGLFWKADAPSPLPGLDGAAARLGPALRLAHRCREVAEREARYRRIFHEIPVSIWEEDFSALKEELDRLRAEGVTDVEAYLAAHPEFAVRAARLIRILDVNDYTLRLFRARSRQELLGSLDKIFTPESFPVFAKEVAALARGERFFECEGQNRTVDGEPLEVLMRVEFPPEKSDLSRVTVSITDITRRKRAEEALRQAREELEARVQARTAELEEAKRRLEEDIRAREAAEAERERFRKELERSRLFEAVGQLAGGVAHDFNNLLGSILGCLYGLRLRLEGDPEALAELDRIRDLCKQGGELTRQLLAIARRQGGRDEAVAVGPLVREAAALLQRTLPRTIRLALEVEPDLPSVRGDRPLLTAALLNLGVNARDAMPRGGEIRLGARPTGDGWVRIWVEDTGVGIPPDVQDRVFEPFFTTKPVGQGTGLGLSMVYATVTEAGGRVSLRSEPGRGTRIELALPAVEAPGRPAAGGDRRPSSHPLCSATVLVVEDEPPVARLVDQALRGAGYRTRWARDGIEGLEAVRDLGADLGAVLLDLVLPRTDGTAVYRVLRELAPEVPVLFITGREDLARSLAPDVPVLSKPFDAADVLAALSELLAGPPVTRCGS